MEQETRKFAIEQAIKLVSVRQDITDKTKAVFDLADDILKYVGQSTVPLNGSEINFSAPPPFYGNTTPQTK